MNTLTMPQRSAPLVLDGFPPFDLSRLLGTVFEPTSGCRICILTDFENTQESFTNLRFMMKPGHPVQKKAVEVFVEGLAKGTMSDLGMTGGEIYAYKTTHGSNLDMEDPCWDIYGNQLSLDHDIYPNYDIILCVSSFSATAPLTAKAKQFGFRGATLHGVNDIILASGLAVDYRTVSMEAEALRLAMTGADRIDIDFELEEGRAVTAHLELGGQEAQKSHGLCHGMSPDVANLPAGEVYFVPQNAWGHFPMKYEDGTLGLLEVENRNIIRSVFIAGNQATIDAQNQRLLDDPMTGTLGELGFNTQELPVSGADIQDEKILGTCHLATGRDDHLGGDITPDLFKRHANATHYDILFAPHKTPDFNLREVRMKRGDQQEVLIRNFRPSEYLLSARETARRQTHSTINPSAS